MNASEAELMRRLKRENRQYRKENERHEKRIAELDGQLGQERKLWSSPESGDRFSDTREAHFVHKREILDDIIANQHKLRPVSSLDRGQFGLVCTRFIEQSQKHPGRPLFSEDGSDEPGNRCKLPYRHVVLMALMRKRGNTIQEQLAVFFGIDQSTVCRYLRFADSVLAEILPTASRVSDRMQKTRTMAGLKKLVPGLAVTVDGTHVDIQRPSSKEPRKEAYSGKKKSFTLNTQIMTNRDGLIIHKSRPAPGSAHDLRMMREDPPDLGMITRMMKSKRRRPDGGRVRLYADLGYVGIRKDYPGAVLRQPHKRRKGGSLTEEQRASNRRINSRRVIVEHAIGRIKHSQHVR